MQRRDWLSYFQRIRFWAWFWLQLPVVPSCPCQNSAGVSTSRGMECLRGCLERDTVIEVAFDIVTISAWCSCLPYRTVTEYAFVVSTLGAVGWLRVYIKQASAVFF